MSYNPTPKSILDFVAPLLPANWKLIISYEPHTEYVIHFYIERHPERSKYITFTMDQSEWDLTYKDGKLTDMGKEHFVRLVSDAQIVYQGANGTT